MPSPLRSHFHFALLACALLFGACAPLAAASPRPTSTSTATSAPTQTIATATAVPSLEGSLQVSLQTGSLASGYHSAAVAAVSGQDGAPYWEVLPRHTLLTLRGYPVDQHGMQPQVWIFPLKELSQSNKATAAAVLALQTWLQTGQETQDMPFLPLLNKAQVLHTHVQPLAFQGGKGLRYLTMFAQGIVPVNNSELIYTFQGLTDDGQYYVAAVLPIHHPSLPEDGKLTGQEPPEFSSDYPSYRAQVLQALAAQPANTFQPDLPTLDAMLSSLEIK